MEVASDVNGNENNAQIGGHKKLLNGSETSQLLLSKQRPANGIEEAKKSQQNGVGVEKKGLPGGTSITKFHIQISKLREAGQRLRSDADQPELLQKPAWFEEDLFENAKCVYGRHFMGMNFAHLSGLLLLVRVNSIYRTLSSTGRSDSVAKLFKRYYQTVVHVKRWYEGDIFEENSEAYNSLLLVRAMHNRVSSSLNGGEQNQANGSLTSNVSGETAKREDESANLLTYSKQANSHANSHANGHTNGLNSNGQTNGVAREGRQNSGERAHISEYDIMLTQFAFVGFIVTRAKHVGLIDDFSEHDLKSLLHFWRVIGFYLGASEQFNLCSRELHQIVGLCEAMMEVEFKESILSNNLDSAPGIMGVNIVRSIKFVPMLTIYGITKYLYELLQIETAQFEARATRYSRLSYTLIKLVMSRLLAYKAFRWFNNALTRLSVFLVGKIEERFANYLDKKYGQVLKL